LPLLDRASITPYYVYMCDMVPHAEHWRTALWEAQAIQEGIMGYLPGYATPRVVCDVPLIGKLWVHQVDEYDRLRGISRWREAAWRGCDGPGESYEYFDPIHTLPAEGQSWWREHARPR
jgi:lysine 2,3-aminomutase